MNNMISEALALGFSGAAIIGTDELVYVPEYRKYCEENLCGNYGKLPVCPPACGTSDQMHERLLMYKNCLVLQSEFLPQEKTMEEFIPVSYTHLTLPTKA